MHVGFTYDLRSDYLAEGYSQEAAAEFDCIETIDAIDAALRALGHEVKRIGNARRLIEALAAGETWDFVFNICEGRSGVGREAQVPAILEVYDIPYTFSDPLASALTLHKGMTKAVVDRAGVATPPWRVVESLAELDDPAFPGFDGPWFAKPNAEGTSKGVSPISRCENADSLKSTARELLAKFEQPVLIEPYLPGREFTVGLFGTGRDAEVFGVLEIILLPAAEQGIYSFANKKLWEDRVRYQLVTTDDPVVRATADAALAAWKALGCRDAGRADLRCDAHGRPQFLEVNPLPGLQPDLSDLPLLANAKKFPYLDLIARIVAEATNRVPADRRSPATPANV
ncbi:MAG TPA: D-alanine--D-alanine ligase [Pirellulales bacterium]